MQLLIILLRVTVNQYDYIKTESNDNINYVPLTQQLYTSGVGGVLVGEVIGAFNGSRGSNTKSGQ